MSGASFRNDRGHQRRLRTIGQLCALIEGSEAVIFQPRDRDGVYAFFQETLVRFRNAKLGKRDKREVLTFLVVATVLSRQQMERLVQPGHVPFTKAVGTGSRACI